MRILCHSLCGNVSGLRIVSVELLCAVDILLGLGSGPGPGTDVSGMSAIVALWCNESFDCLLSQRETIEIARSMRTSLPRARISGIFM